MRLPDLTAALESIEGTRLCGVDPAAARVTLVRASDGVDVQVRLLPASTFDGYRDPGDVLVVARWEEPGPPGPGALARANAAAVLSVAAAHRPDDLYGAPRSTFHRAQLLATDLDPGRFAAGLARDLGLATGGAPSPSVSLDALRDTLHAHPVVSREQALLDALFGAAPDRSGKPFERRGDELAGPSSVGMPSVPEAIPVTVRVDALGFVRVRHERPLGDRAIDRLLDGVNDEASTREDLVSYHRGFPVADGRIAVEFTATPRELSSELFARKMRALEIAVGSQLG